VGGPLRGKRREKKEERKQASKRGSNMSLVGDVYCHHNNNKIIELFGRKEHKHKHNREVK
jgi:hypothetical protein